MSRIRRLWLTLSPQKPQQWRGRIVDTLKRKTYDKILLKSSLNRGIDGELGLQLPEPLPQWLHHDCDVDLPAKRFRFLNENKHFDDGIDWQFDEYGYLWRFNLHYFEYLPQSGESGAAVVKDWIAKNPAPSEPGWHPYVISLRIIHWCKWLWQNPRLADQEILHSLAQQANYLAGHLEFRLLANHLLENARALLFAAAALDVPAAKNWRQKAEMILNTELEEQVLPDGLHFERSWMYHGLMLMAYLDIVLLGHVAHVGQSVTTMAEACSKRMAAALEQAMIRDTSCLSGRYVYALFKDAAQGIAPSPDALINHAREVLNLEVNERENITVIDGFYIHRDQVTEAMIEGGRLLPTYNPGHAHADLFSYQLHLNGKPFVVDTGTSTYERGLEREHERSTVAHNTISIDGENSSDVWAGFRVGRRAEPHDIQWYTAGDLTVFSAWHDGFRRLPSRPKYYRTIMFLRDAAMIVLDRVECETSERSQEHVAESAIHLAPDVHPLEQSLDCVAIGEIRLLALHDGQWKTAPSQHAPEFGKRLNNVRISLVKRFTGLVDIGYIWSWRGEIEAASHEESGGIRLESADGTVITIQQGSGGDSRDGEWRITS